MPALAPWHPSSTPPRGEGALHSPAPSCSSFFQDVQQRALCHILRGRRMRTQDPGTLPRTTLAPVPLGGILGGEAWRGCSSPHSSLEKVRGRGWGGGPGVGGRGWKGQGLSQPRNF